MTNFVLGIFEITVGMSLIIALLILGLKLFGGKFTAKCRYVIWVLIMLRLAIPFSIGLLPTFIEIPIEAELVQTENPSSAPSANTEPTTSSQPAAPGDISLTPTVPGVPIFPTAPNTDPATPDSVPTFPANPAEPVSPAEPLVEAPAQQPISPKQILDIAGIVYLIGAAVFLMWSFVSYFIYTRKILRSARAADYHTQQIFYPIWQKNGIKKQPTLLVASGIHSPVAFGIFHRRILLPDIAFSDNGLVGTLAHEVTHCKRGDLYVKLVELIARSFHWFNPLVHIAAFRCEMEMELSCDEKVLSGSSEAARAAYADVMLDMIRRCRRNNGALTTHFNPKKRAVTARFKNIIYGSGKRRGRILIGVCLVFCLLAGTIVACQTGEGTADDHWYAEGYYLKCDNGSDVIIMDAEGEHPASPCKMTAADDSVSFAGLTDGDRIKIEISVIMTTYPGQTEVYSLEKLSDGEREDIDAAILESLCELGWIDEETSDQKELPNYLEIPTITLTQMEALPYSEETAVFTASPVGGNPTVFFFDNSLTFYFRSYPSIDTDAEYFTGTLTLPDGFTDAKLLYVTRGAGSGEIFVSIEAMWNGEKEYLTYAFFGMEVPSGVDVLDDIQIRRLMETLEQIPAALFVTRPSDYEEADVIDISSDDYGEVVAVTSNVDLDGIKIVEIVRDDNFEIAELITLHTVDLVAGEPMLLKVSFPGVTGNRGLIYRDTDGEKKCFEITRSGEDGKILLISSESMAEKVDDMTEEHYTSDVEKPVYNNYEEFVADIYLCDDVYRGKDTPTHGTASIRIPMAQDVLELKDYDILLCGDGCDPAAVVSRASQGYAPVYRVVSDGEIDGNFKTLKFKMEIPKGMLEDIKRQGVYEQIIEKLGSQYYYLLVLDKNHYAYIHLQRIEGVEKIERETELADGIVKNARISFKPKKLDPIEHSYTSDVDSFIPENASSVPKVTVLTTGKMILTYETEEKLPLVYFGQVVDAESVCVTQTEFEDPGFEYTAHEVIDYLYESGYNVYATVRFTRSDGKQTDVYYYGYMTENPYGISDHDYKWTVFSAEDANELNLARGQYDPAKQAELIPNQNAQGLFWLKAKSICYYFCSIRTLNGAGNAYTDEPPKDFAIYYQQYDQNYFSVIDEPIPEEYPYDSIVPVVAITGEGCATMRCILQLTDGDRTYYISYQSYPGIDQVYHPVSDDEAKMLAKLYPGKFEVDDISADINEAPLQSYYQMWYDKKLTTEELLNKSEVREDIAKKVKNAVGVDLHTVSFTWEYRAEEDRYPLRFFVTDDAGEKMIEANIIRYKDETDGIEKFAVEVNSVLSMGTVNTEVIFTSILENKQSFYDASSKESMLLSEYKAKTDYSVKKYTILDLNDDRDPEMVLWLGYGTNDYVGYLVLHRYENAVYVHEFPYRGFTGLKADGVYTSSSSAFNVSICKLAFEGDTCAETVLARREGDGTLESITYYIEDRKVTKAEFDAYEAAQSAKPDAIWAIPALNTEAALIPVLGEVAEAGEAAQILGERVIDGVRYLVYRKADMQTFTAWEKDGKIIRMNELTQGQYENFRVIDILKVTDVLGRDAVKIIHGGTHPEATYYFLTDGLPDVYCEAYGAVSEISLDDAGTQSILASWMGRVTVIRLQGDLPVQTTVDPAAMSPGQWIVYDAERGLFQISRNEADRTVSNFYRLIGNSFVPVGE